MELQDNFLKAIARACEAAYRRGVHHAFYYLRHSSSELDFDLIADEAYGYRFDADLDTSKGLGGEEMSSVERFNKNVNWSELL